MCIGIKIMLAIFFGAWGSWMFALARKTNVKNEDDFKKASIFKKLDMIFTEEDDLLNANKWRGVFAVVSCYTLMILYIVSIFNE